MAEQDNATSNIGHHSKTMSEMKAGLNVDTASISKFQRAFDGVVKTIKTAKEEMQALAKASKEVQAPGASGGPATAKNGMSMGQNTSMPMDYGRKGGGVGGGAGGGDQGGSGPFGGHHLSGGQKTAAAATVAAGYGVGKGLAALDSRVDTNRQYSIVADRLSMDMQQRYGMSQNQIANQYRKPLTDYRLGNNGINEMLSFQTRTGINAQQQAGGVAGIRAMSGYSMGTEDVLGIYQQNLDPSRANRQFMMMGGLSAYGPGGEPRDQAALMRQRTRMFGLTDPSTNKGAIRQGSNSRFRMEVAGIGVAEQDLMINYGQAQNSFTERGGKGNYDPSNKEHMKIMGIDENFAAQAEETDRVRTNREENMYRRQADNYADLEKSNQTLIEALGGVEDALQFLVGARTSTRPWQKIAGRVLGVGGLGAISGLSLMGGGDPLEGGGGNKAAAAPSGVTSNSSSSNDSSIKIPVGYGGGRKTLNEVKTRSDFQKMHPKMQQRMLSMFRENPNVGIGGGFRDSKAQEDMFLSRHEPTSEDTGIKWQGKFWKRVRGAPAAPPGKSMHEIGLAADLVGDLSWMNKNASRFGLKHFAGVNNEPWHVQPSELPNSRRDYEEAGASWGTNGDHDEDAVFTGNPGDSGDSHEEAAEHSSYGGHGLGGVTEFTGMSMSQIVEAFVLGGEGGGGFGPSGRGSPHEDSGSSSSSTASAAVSFNGTVGSGPMAAAQAAFKVGFRGQNLKDIVAIAGRESGWDPSAINPNSDDTGMWQIAPMNWGSHTQQNLLNVDANASVARRLFEADGWQGWTAANSRHKVNGVWKVDPSGKGGPGWAQDGDHMWHTGEHVAEASAAATSVENSSGDPTDSAVHTARAPRPQVSRPSTVNGSGGGVAMHNTYQIEFSPVLNFAGSGPTDVRAMATEVEVLLKESMNRALDRSA